MDPISTYAKTYSVLYKLRPGLQLKCQQDGGSSRDWLRSHKAKLRWAPACSHTFSEMPQTTLTARSYTDMTRLCVCANDHLHCAMLVPRQATR